MQTEQNAIYQEFKPFGRQIVFPSYSQDLTATLMSMQRCDLNSTTAIKDELINFDFQPSAIDYLSGKFNV